MKVGTIVLMIFESVFIAILWINAGFNGWWIAVAWIVAMVINGLTKNKTVGS